MCIHFIRNHNTCLAQGNKCREPDWQTETNNMVTVTQTTMTNTLGSDMLSTVLAWTLVAHKHS